MVSPNRLTGQVLIAEDTEVLIFVTSTRVAEDSMALAPIPSVTFVLGTVAGPISSGSVALAMVEGPPPEVTRFAVVNGITAVPAGQTTTIQFEGESNDAGNIWFFFIGGTDSNTVNSWTSSSTSPGHTLHAFSITATISADRTGDYGFVWGLVDGAGHKAFGQILLPIQPMTVASVPAALGALSIHTGETRSGTATTRDANNILAGRSAVARPSPSGVHVQAIPEYAPTLPSYRGPMRQGRDLKCLRRRLISESPPAQTVQPC